MPNKQILVVEDDEMTVLLMTRILGKQVPPDRVQVVHDGAEALDYLHCKGSFATRAPGLPTVILLDNNMPRMSGLELLQVMLSERELKRIPVVMFTSSDNPCDRASAYDLGANAYVVKPMGYGEMSKAIGAVVEFWANVNRTAHDRG